MSARRQDGVRVPPESLGDYAVRSIREDLITGSLRPGQRVNADALARDLGISHVPVREALRFLEAEGHIDRGPRAQLRVRPVAPNEAGEIYRLREILEAEAHARSIPKLVDADLELMQLHYQRMEEAVAKRDIASFARSNRDFHFVAFERSEQQWLLRFLRIIWDAAARYQSSLFQEDGWQSALQSHHADLLVAMKARDIYEVNRLMNLHRHVTVDAAHGFAAGAHDD